MFRNEFRGEASAAVTVGLVLVFMLMEWLGRERHYALADMGSRWKRPVRYAMYYAIILAILWLGGKAQQFIYFQF